MLTRNQQNYIDVSIKIPQIQNTITSRDEIKFKKTILSDLGLIEDIDYKHQFCFHDNETLISVDFYFPNHKLVIEIDGSSHKDKDQRKKDKIRDKICFANGLKVLRIKSPMTKQSEIYWFRFLKEFFRVEG